MRRLGVTTRRVVLITHIASAGTWLGIDVAMAVVIFTALATDDVGTRVFSLQALEVFTIWPLLVTGVICLLSGIVLGLGSKWGLLRYWWVVVKLALNLILSVLVVVALRRRSPGWLSRPGGSPPGRCCRSTPGT